MTAERVMKETRDNASKKGELIVKDAEMQAQRVLEDCRLRTEELRREIVVLRKEKESYLSRFKNLAQAQIQFVETHESDFEDLFPRDFRRPPWPTLLGFAGALLFSAAELRHGSASGPRSIGLTCGRS